MEDVTTTTIEWRRTTIEWRRTTIEWRMGGGKDLRLRTAGCGTTTCLGLRLVTGAAFCSTEVRGALERSTVKG